LDLKNKRLYSIKIKDKIMKIEELITIIIAILIAFALFKFFVWILPIVIVLIIAYVIYKFIRERY